MEMLQHGNWALASSAILSWCFIKCMHFYKKNNKITNNVDRFTKNKNDVTEISRYQMRYALIENVSSSNN